MTTDVCQVAMRHGTATHTVTYPDRESFRLCWSCAVDALNSGVVVTVERVAA